MSTMHQYEGAQADVTRLGMSSQTITKQIVFAYKQNCKMEIFLNQIQTTFLTFLVLLGNGKNLNVYECVDNYHTF